MISKCPFKMSSREHAFLRRKPSKGVVEYSFYFLTKYFQDIMFLSLTTQDVSTGFSFFFFYI